MFSDPVQTVGPILYMRGMREGRANLVVLAVAPADEAPPLLESDDGPAEPRTLARFGGSPLPQHPIRLRPLPGKSAVYTAQRNYLVVERRSGRWYALWELEEDGATPAIAL